MGRENGAKNPQNINVKYVGFPVRCIKADPVAAAIVPEVASTAAPDNAGSDGPRFSIAITDASFTAGSAPLVTIDGQICANVSVNSAGTALTCSGPTANLTAGTKAVTINGNLTTATVTYSDDPYPTLQSLFTTAGCSATPTIYRDSRDSQLYYAAKLDDGKCWMLDNLKYQPDGDTAGSVTNSFTATQVWSGLLTADGTDATGTNYNNYNATKYVDAIASTVGSNYCRNNTNKPANNVTKCGFLYNFYTTTAGTAPNTYSTTYSTAPGSICPANWHLPTGAIAAVGTDSDYKNLDVLYGGTGGWQSSPIPTQVATLWNNTGTWAGVFSGTYETTFSGQGSYGDYWSSSVATAIKAFDLSFLLVNNVNPGGNQDVRYFGLAVRCVLSDDPAATPPAAALTNDSKVVPNFASTITPAGNGNPDPFDDGVQFSMQVDGLGIAPGSHPSVQIDDTDCANVSLSDDGKSLTCTGLSGMTAGEKTVKINYVDVGPAYHVWYSDYNFPTLQSVTAATCPSTPVIFRDIRDSGLYYAAKLDDGKCWMLDNLKYKPNGGSAGALTPFVASQVWSGSLTADGTSDTTSPNLDSAKYTDPISAAYCVSKTGLAPTNLTKCGLLYNFYTATAGSAPQSESTIYSTAASSICPSGWRLPTGINAPNPDTSSDFQNLDLTYGGRGEATHNDTTVISKLWLPSGAWTGVLSGVYGSTLDAQGYVALYWSSSIDSADRAYNLTISSTSVSPGTAQSTRHGGFAIRCVADS
jgi:uncharacterized protein (TIGR02145 family)